MILVLPPARSGSTTLRSSRRVYQDGIEVGTQSEPGELLLGTKGIKDTVERALDEVIAYAARRKAVEQLRTMQGLDLDDAKVMARAWR